MEIRNNNDLQLAYEKSFNEKIDSFKEHPQYEWLRQYANYALQFYIGNGYLAIKAIDFMDRIIQKPIGYIRDWLDNKNELEW